MSIFSSNIFQRKQSFYKIFEIIRDKVLLKDLPISPKWYSNEYSIIWSFKEKELEGLNLGVVPDFTEFYLSRKNLTLEEKKFFGGNINIYVKKCNILSNPKFFDKLKTLKKEYQKEYNRKMIKNKI